MCGIAGICRFHGFHPPTLKKIKAMTAAIRHRGPDQAGIYIDDQAALGHARLTIIGLESGIQPLANEERSLWLTYNGEVYNYLELKADLKAKGHRFSSDTDAEVVIHLFEEHGPNCLQYLNGQFAFALWDSRRKRLFMARDRFGIRPLYYCQVNGSLYFASEIKSIFSTAPVDRKLNLKTLDHIFTFWTPLPGETAFDGIQELPPAHFMLADSRHVTVTKYWDIAAGVTLSRSMKSFAAACEHLVELLHDSVRLRLRADVPVVCYLSGGLDSSVVAALAADKVDSILTTFGIRFRQIEYDEGAFQQLAASRFHTRHRWVSISNREIYDRFADTLWHCEQPVLRTAPVPLFLLSRQIHESGCKVALTGEGADEIFAGYNIFKEMKVRRFWARRPQSFCRPLLLAKLYPYVFTNARLNRHLQSFFAKGLTETDSPYYSHLLRWWNTARLKKFFSPDVKAATQHHNPHEAFLQFLPDDFSTWDDLQKAQYLEIILFMSHYLLSSQGDRVAMAHSVEVRMPYLDHRLAEFAWQLPARWKMPALREKYILKEAARNLVPQEIIHRPKTPFRAPVFQTLWHTENKMSREHLSKRAIHEAGLFDARKVSYLLTKLDHNKGAGEMDSMALCAILSCQILHQQYVLDFSTSDGHDETAYLLIDRRSTGTKKCFAETRR